LAQAFQVIRINQTGRRREVTLAEDASFVELLSQEQAHGRSLGRATVWGGKIRCPRCIRPPSMKALV
jgi:hypothetical protein